MKKDFEITITETLQRTITIPADSLDEAKSIAEDMYKASEIVLSSEDFTVHTIEGDMRF